MSLDGSRLEALATALAERLAGGLPGTPAQLRMAPRPKRPGWEPGVLPETARDGAALALLFPVRGAAHLLLTVRGGWLAQHAGQVSLPGGAVEPGESIEQAALREANEEVGLDPHRVRLLGRLTPLHIPVSGFNLHPVVGVTEERPEWQVCAREVSRILEVPVAVLADPAVVASEEMLRPRGDLWVPYFAVEGEKVWGATAMILAELLTLLGW